MNMSEISFSWNMFPVHMEKNNYRESFIRAMDMTELVSSEPKFPEISHAPILRTQVLTYRDF
jgi:hypothetical protein